GRNVVPTIMAPGKRRGVIAAALAGEDIGTLFLPGKHDGLNRRKHWIAYTLKPSGKVFVDAGAAEVLLKKGKSLLPSGVNKVEGRFDRGSSVRVCGPDGVEFARGLSDYSSIEIARLLGKKSSEIEKILGYRYSDVIIHRDNLVVL
ncbi:MAG: PUA domain-containing protein, partial [Deltaproteobacteria bacterium]